MNDAARLGAGVAVSMHMGHHIMPQLPLIAVGGGEVDVVDILPELLDLCGGNIETQFGFGLGQRDPKPPPRAELSLGAPQARHFTRSVAADQGVFVEFVHGGRMTNS